MKKLLLLLLSTVSVSAMAQYYALPSGAGNPNGINTETTEYPANGGGLPSSWSTIVQAASSSGTYSASQTLPFTFLFNGDTVTTFKASNTGIVTFSQASTLASNSGATAVSLSSSDVPDSSIVVLGLNGSGSNDYVVTKTIGTAPNRQQWVFYPSFSVTGTSTSHWSYWGIVMEETSNMIYIVDMRNYGVTPSLNIGVRVDSATTVALTGVGSFSSNSPDPSDNTYYPFAQGVQPDYDMGAVAINLNTTLGLTDGPFAISADFQNAGAATLASATLNYTVNGGTPVTTSLTGLNVAPLASMTATAGTNWSPSTTGNYTIKAWLNDLNGTNVDAQMANDTASIDIVMFPALAQRIPLYETFTSSTCAPCTPANTNMQGIFANNPGEYTSIKYQMSWPGTGDPYYFSEGGTRRTFYAVSSVPNVAIDGGWNGNGNSLTQGIFDEFAAEPALVEMTATFSRWSKIIEATVEVEALADLSSSNMALFAAIYSLRDTANVKTNGETEFFHVVKKLMPDDDGQAFAPMSANDVRSVTLSYEFNGTYVLPPNANSPVNLATNHTVEDFNNLGVVFWIQDMTTKEVFQSTDAAYTIGQLENSLARDLKVYPNPSSDVVFVEGDVDEEVTVRVLDLTGRTISEQRSFLANDSKMIVPVSGLPAGTYILSMESKGRAHAQPLIVK